MASTDLRSRYLPSLIREICSEKMADDDFADEVYAALCNVEWVHDNGDTFVVTWRTAGAIVAEIRDQGEDYIDFYCNGNEGVVTERIREPLGLFGWKGIPRA